MIEYAFLALGTGGTAAVAYAVAPAGRGLHRYTVPRSKLRAMAARAEADASELAELLDSVCDERDKLAVHYGQVRALLGKAERLVADAEDEARQLREANAELRARLLAAVRPVLAVTAVPIPATPTPSDVAMPLHRAPFAISPTSKPS
ncbi:hypothetical protein [Streptomyces sp. NPDC002328]|uniref:hypothetical protein n=1 Tax=Streptomyces sp. NPDC002328 TaxID=3364642 RepID=UPI0036CDB2AF